MMINKNNNTIWILHNIKVIFGRDYMATVNISIYFHITFECKIDIKIKYLTIYICQNMKQACIIKKSMENVYKICGLCIIGMQYKTIKNGMWIKKQSKKYWPTKIDCI